MPILHLPHPSPRALQRFADGELAPRTHARVSRHLASCPRCRAAVTFSRELRGALAGLEAAPAPPAVIERVLAERAAGVRAVLPVDAAPPHRSARRRTATRMLAAGAAAAIAAALALRAEWRPDRRRATPAPIVRSAPPRELAPEPRSLGAILFPQAAFAAQPARRDLPTSPGVRLSGVRLRPTRLVYARLRAGPDGHARELGRGTQDLAVASIEGRDAWRLAQQWRFADTVRAETVFVDRASLAMLGRTVHVAPYMRYRGITVRQRIVGDSVVGWMNTEQGLGRPIARRLPPAYGPYISDAFATLALSGTGLSPAWRGSLSLLGWAVRPEDVYLPVEMRVAGEERVTVPAGTFDCWRLTLRVEDGTQTYWVRKADGVGVRARDESPRDGRGATEIVLVRG